MKKSILLGLMLLLIKVSFSQFSVSGSFNATTPGLYYTLGTEFTSFHHRFGGGLNINQAYASGDEYGGVWELKPNAPNEYFGLNMNYGYVFYPEFSDIEPFLFFDLNYQFCGTRSGRMVANGNLVTFYEDAPPFNTFTESIGFGFTTDVYKKIYLIIKAGLGLIQENTFNDFEASIDGATYKLSAGLGYRFSDWQRSK